jgi:hypothetical protein
MRGKKIAQAIFGIVSSETELKRLLNGDPWLY